MKSRADSVSKLVTGEIDEGKKAIDKVADIKPVQAVNGLVGETVDNVSDFIDEQCEITRRWASGV